MRNTSILLIEDNPDDEKLTIRAFHKNMIANPVIVARNGRAAPDPVHPRRSHVR